MLYRLSWPGGSQSINNDSCASFVKTVQRKTQRFDCQWKVIINGQGWLILLFFCFSVFILPFNPCTYTQRHTPTALQEGGGVLMEPSPLAFLICRRISKRFCPQWKAFDLLYKRRYILWVVALLEVCDVTKHGRHLGFYQELGIR